MSVKVQKITEPLILGEAPHWDEKQQALYFVDILDHSIHKYVLATGVHTKTKVGGHISFIVPVEGKSDQFLVGMDRKFRVLRWDGAEGSPVTVVKEVGEVDQDVPNAQLNDGKADPRGRVYSGTMKMYWDTPGKADPHKGSLYRVDGSKITKVADGITISNGMAWDLKEKAMYYIDSKEKKIRRYDYDVETGDISNLKYIFDLKENKIEGAVDGTTIDADGNLWFACIGDSIMKIDPRTGQLLVRLEIPVKQVTSATFGGPNLDILFVTTTSLNVVGPPPPSGGATFMVTGLGVKGSPNISYKL